MTNINLVLNDGEQQAFHQLLDTALRQAGLNALNVVSHFFGRLSDAQQANVPLNSQGAVLLPAAAASPSQPATPIAQGAVHAAQPGSSQPSGQQPAASHPAAHPHLNTAAANSGVAQPKAQTSSPSVTAVSANAIAAPAAAKH